MCDYLGSEQQGTNKQLLQHSSTSFLSASHPHLLSFPDSLLCQPFERAVLPGISPNHIITHFNNTKQIPLIKAGKNQHNRRQRLLKACRKVKDDPCSNFLDSYKSINLTTITYMQKTKVNFYQFVSFQLHFSLSVVISLLPIHFI